MKLHNFGNNNPYTLFEKKMLHVLNKEVPLKSELMQCNTITV